MFSQSKEQLAEIELSARQRAKEVEERAAHNAKRTRVQSAEVISAVKREVEAVCEAYRSAAEQAKQRAQRSAEIAASTEETLTGVLTMLDEAVVSELSDEKTNPARSTVQQVLELLRKKEGENDGTL